MLFFFLIATPAGAADKNGVSPSAISLPKGPGSIEGFGESFQPTLNTGTASYGIALSLPPGTVGRQPTLRLRYEGGGGNGVLGYGWSLPLPLIQRRSDRGIPLYEDDLGLERTDRFINEMKEELVPQADGYYFSENEGAFIRYRLVGDHWEGTEPDGTKLVFGLTTSGRIEDAGAGRVFGWLLERETDTHGNTVVYEYRAFEGEANRNQKFLHRVSYGPGAPPFTSFHFVTFEYEDRSDWFEDCRSGFVVRCGKRMHRIVTGTQGGDFPGHLAGDWNGDGQRDFLNRQYELGYLNYAGADTHWSLLSRVQVVGSDGTSRLPATRLGYAVCHPPGSLSAEGQALGGTNEPTAVMDSGFVELADVNGDGLPDVLRTFAGDLPHQVFLNQGVRKGTKAVAWRAPEVMGGDARAWGVNLQSALSVAHLADMNGDGLADLAVKSTTGEIFFFANQGRLSWATRQLMADQGSAPPSPFGLPGVRAADLDFDKRMDVIQSLNLGGGIAYRIWFNLGDQRYAPSLTVEPPDAFDLADPTVQIGDFNGDRVPDLIRLRPERLLVKAGLGYGRFADAIAVALPDATLSTDQLRQAKLTDVTGDGMADLVVERAAPGQLWYWINRGNYELSTRKAIDGMPLVSGQRAVVRWADMNGNGTTDLIYADAESEPRLQTIDVGEIINCGATPNILNSIANGLGRTISIRYESSIHFRLEDEAAGQPWPNVMPFSVPVVAGVTTADSLGHEYRTEYRYHDGYYDPKQKQFRGFARVEQIEVGDPTAPTLVSRSFFDTGHQYESMKGRLLRQMVEEVDGQVYWDESTTWKLPPVVLKAGTNGQSVTFVHPTTHSKMIKERGQGVVRVVEQEFGYDQFGNQTMKADFGIVEDGNRTAFNDERVTTTEYALNLDAWMLRHPKRTETRDLNGLVLSRTESFYDDETFSGNNLGAISVGDLTLERDWMDPSNPAAYIKSSRNKYDAYGNATVMLDPLAEAPEGEVDLTRGHARIVTYSSGFHNYAVTEAIHLGGGKSPLVFRATYDEAFGMALSGTDFNNHTTYYTYDPFARVTSIRKPGDTPEFPTSEYDYVLAVPFGPQGLVNYVETRLLDQTLGSLAGKRDHYMISREFVDGMGRKLMSKKEAGSDRGNPSPGVIVNSAVTFNARTTTLLALNPFLSTVGESVEELLAYESIEAPGWKGRFHEGGTLRSLDLEQAHKTTTIYDATQREVRSVNPDGSFEATHYEPLLVRSYDANQTDPGSPFYGASLAHFHDGLGRLVRVEEISHINDDGTPAATTKTWTTRYEHDLNDQLTQITDSQNNVKRMRYDGLARLISMNDPDRGFMGYRFDDASNLIETTDARDQRIRYTYDGANRMLSEDFHDPKPGFPSFNPAEPITASNRPDVAFFYDAPVADIAVGDGTVLTARNTVGLLAYVWDLTGEEHYSYDAREHATVIVKRVMDPLHGNLVSYRTGLTFDALDRLTSVLYPDNDLVSYEYNERGVGKSIRGGPSGSIVSEMLYSPSGQLTSVKYGNGVQTSNAYDVRLRLQQVRTWQPQLGLEHVGFSYTFDAASNIKAIDDLRPGSAIPDGNARRNTQRVDYDDLYRMTRVRYSFGAPGAPFRADGEIQYRYDRIGNLLSQTSGMGHFEKGQSVTDLGELAYGGSAGRANRNGRAGNDPPGPHAMTEIRKPDSEVRNYRYDANGNMLAIDGLKTTWDFKDRLTVVESGELLAEYNYDHRDRRVTKRVIGKGAAGSVAGQTDSTIYVDQYFEVRQNSVPVKYVWNGNTRVARVTGKLSSDERVQRLRLWSGWNLCSLAVTADRAGEQLSAGGMVRAIFRWDPADLTFKTLAAADTVMAGSVLWVNLMTNSTVSVRGTHAGNTSPDKLPGGGRFHPGSLAEPVEPAQFAPIRAAIWRFDAANQSWQARLGAAVAGLSNLPDSLTPGEGVFVRADSEIALSLPDEALGIRYYHQDHLGSSAVIADANGVGLEEVSFYPFGFPRHSEKSPKLADPYQFTQKEHDRESGLNNMEARYQSPILGRFLRVDPLAGSVKSGWLAQPQRLNLYAYCANSPLGNSDPSGTDLVGAFKGFGIGVAEGAWDAGNPLNGVTVLVSATVAVAKTVEHQAVKGGGILVETYNGNYKEALKIAFVDEKLVKIMDPKTSDEEAGRIIGNTTGQALVAVATSKAGPGKGSPAPGPPAPRLPPAPVVVGRPMSAAAQTAKTQPAITAPKTIRDPTLPTSPNNPRGLGRLPDKRYGAAERVQWEKNNVAKGEMYAEEFSRRIKEARPAMDKMIEQTGSAKPILKKIGQEVEAVYGNWD